MSCPAGGRGTVLVTLQLSTFYCQKSQEASKSYEEASRGMVQAPVHSPGERQDAAVSHRCSCFWYRRGGLSLVTIAHLSFGFAS